MSECSFQPLLFGGDINVYSVARAFHEAYGVKSIAEREKRGGGVRGQNGDRYWLR